MDTALMSSVVALALPKTFTRQDPEDLATQTRHSEQVTTKTCTGTRTGVGASWEKKEGED